MAEGEQTIDLSNINGSDSNVEENITDVVPDSEAEAAAKAEEERLAAEAAAKAEEERLAAEAAAKAEEERLAAETGLTRNKKYIDDLTNGKRRMTDEDKKYIIERLNTNQKKTLKSIRPAAINKFLRNAINDTMY